MADYRVSKKALAATGPNPTQAVLEAVMAKTDEAEVRTGSSAAREIFMRQLTPGQRAVFAIARFEMELNGGGFDAYFRHAAGDYALDATAGLRMVDASRFESVLTNAISLFPGRKPDRDTDKRAEQLESIVAKAPDAFENLDSEFFDSYAGEESLGKLLIVYIRAHPAEFFVD